MPPRSSDLTLKYEQPLDAPSSPKSSWKAVGEPDTPTWKLSRSEGTWALWEKPEAPLRLPKRERHFFHSRQLSPFHERLELPFPDGEILSINEEDVSSIRDRFTTWVTLL